MCEKWRTITTRRGTRLSDDTLVWKGAFTNLLGEMCPGEVFEIVAAEDAGGARFELVTESARVMVAWAEVQEAVAKLAEQLKNSPEINDLRSQ